MKIPVWAIPTFHSVHTLHGKICYDLSCDMDAMEGISTGTPSASSPIAVICRHARSYFKLLR